ncbi:MAG: DUF2911 domain-containing protein [Saprospiraceae bacterium]|nr:DUF2911 domain-containing protein [Saprospiraceae bacterium]
MKYIFNCFLCMLLSVVCTTPYLSAQTLFELPSTNSRAIINQQVASTHVKVEYNRPNTKGRKIFGGLVPLGKIWRTGSDASTKLYFSTPVSLNNQALDSGTYELFTIPNVQEWTIILQKSKSQWGSYSYKIENDALRFFARPEKMEKHCETFTINFENISSNSAEISLNWEKQECPYKLPLTCLKQLFPNWKKVYWLKVESPISKPPCSILKIISIFNVPLN